MWTVRQQTSPSIHPLSGKTRISTKKVHTSKIKTPNHCIFSILWIIVIGILYIPFHRGEKMTDDKKEGGDKKGEERKGIKLYEDHERGGNGGFKVTMLMFRLMTI